MTKNVRFHLPSVYKELVDWPAIEKWNRKFLLEHVGNNVVIGYDYLGEGPNKPFAGRTIFKNQKGIPMPINSFMDRLLKKFFNSKLSNPLDKTNLFIHEPIPEKLYEDFWEPDAINVAFELERTTWSIMGRNT